MIRRKIEFLSRFGGLFALALVSCGDGLLPEPAPRNVESNGVEVLDELREVTELGRIPEAVPTFPVKWTLTDVGGRSIDATLIGRNGSAITLIRNSDGKRFELALDRLSPDDRTRVEKLPNKTPPSRHPMESSHYRMAQAKLDEIDAGINEMKVLYNTTNSEIQRRTAGSQLKRLQAARLELLEDHKELEKY